MVFEQLQDLGRGEPLAFPCFQVGQHFIRDRQGQVPFEGGRWRIVPTTRRTIFHSMEYSQFLSKQLSRDNTDGLRCKPNDAPGGHCSSYQKHEFDGPNALKKLNKCPHLTTM
jgi:hypothetical protein